MTKEEIKLRDYIIEKLIQENNEEKTKNECHQLLRLGKKWKDDKAIGSAYYYLAYSDLERGRYQRCIENVQEALPYLKRCQEFLLCTKAFNIQGIAYSELGNEVLALESYLEGMDSAKENHVTDMQVWLYNNIGSRFQELKEHKEAIYYLDKARKYFNIGKRKERLPYYVIMVVYMNLGSSYTHLGEYERAMEVLQEAARIAEENQDTIHRFSMIYLFSILYWRIGNREYAYEHLDELVEMAAKSSNMNDYTQNITEFIEFLMEIEEYERVEQMIAYYETHAREQGSVYLSIHAVEFWLSYYEQRKDDKKYQEYALKYAALSREQKKQQLSERAQIMKLKIALKEKENKWKKAQKREEALKKKSEKDALTGLGNRYLLENYSKKLIAKALKEQRIVGIGVLDIDCFKQYNDTYGHLAGDKCLVKVAEVIQEKVGNQGKCFRYGGDEFVILVENGTEDILLQIAMEIRKELEKKKVANRNSTVKKTLTISQGYACLKPEKEYRLNQILECADIALYAVKEAGKDNYQVVNI